MKVGEGRDDQRFSVVGHRSAGIFFRDLRKDPFDLPVFDSDIAVFMDTEFVSVFRINDIAVIKLHCLLLFARMACVDYLMIYFIMCTKGDSP